MILSKRVRQLRRHCITILHLDLDEETYPRDHHPYLEHLRTDPHFKGLSKIAKDTARAGAGFSALVQIAREGPYPSGVYIAAVCGAALGGILPYALYGLWDSFKFFAFEQRKKRKENAHEILAAIESLHPQEGKRLAAELRKILAQHDIRSYIIQAKEKKGHFIAVHLNSSSPERKLETPCSTNCPNNALRPS